MLLGHFALGADAGLAIVGDVLLLPPRPAARGRPGVRRALPAQSALRRRAAAADRAATRAVGDFIEADPAFAPFFDGI